MKILVNGVRLLFLGVFLWLMVTEKMVVWLGIFSVSLILALLAGRVFCGWICPMNTVMIPMEWLSKKLHLQRLKEPEWLKSPSIPWIMLVGSIMTMIILKRAGIDAPILLYMLLLSMIITLFYKSEVFHNRICPFGLLQGFAGKHAQWTHRVSENDCIGCKRCETVCPSRAVAVSSITRKAMIDPMLCHQCMNCQEVCPKDAIAYKSKR